MKKEKRVFNFNLPNELRSYLKKQSEDNHTTISQYLIDLIVFIIIVFNFIIQVF
jgi:hypothetical protein